MSPVLLALLCRCILSHRQLYTSLDWTQPQYYTTVKVVAAEDKIVHFTRGSEGVLVSMFDTTLQKWTISREYAWMQDSQAWVYEKYYGTIYLVPVGSKVYIFGRAGISTRLTSFDTLTSLFRNFPGFAYLTDSEGFFNPVYYKTIRVAAVGTSIYISARDSTGIRLACCNTLTSTWSLLPTLNQFTDNAIWTQEKYYLTFQMVAQGTNLWFIMRGSAGIYLFSFDTLSTVWSYNSSPVNSQYSDSQNWGSAPYFYTFQMVPVSNGLYIAARGPSGLAYFFYDTVQAVLTATDTISEYSDSNGWMLEKYSRTVKISTCGDLLIYGGRADIGYKAGYLDAPGGLWYIKQNLPYFTDAQGWNTADRYSGLLNVCVEGVIYVIGRNMDNLETHRMSLSGNTWNSAETITSLPCNSACKVCLTANPSDCTYCYSNAHLNGISPNYCICDSCFFPDSTPGNCSKCSTICSECIGPSPQSCTACPSDIQLVNPPVSVCGCIDGFYRNTALVCVACDPQCESCTGEGPLRCSRCKAREVLDGGRCVCQQGYYLRTAGNCDLCDSSCLACSSASLCSLCKGGAALDTYGKCSCVTSYFPNSSNGDCEPCLKPCLGCLSASVCTSCYSNAEIRNNTCVCSAGFFGAANNCAKCPIGCLTCTILLCEHCFPGYFSVKQECLLHCPPNSSEDTINWLCLPLPNPYNGVNVTILVEQTNSVLINFSQAVEPQLQLTHLLLILSDTDSHEYNVTSLLRDIVEKQTYNLSLVVIGDYLPANNELSIVIIHPEMFVDSFGNHLLSTQFVVALPPIGPVPKALYQATVSSTTSALTTSATMGGLVTGLLSSNPTAVFSLINNVQMITYFPLSTVDLPESLKARMVSMNLQAYLPNPFSVSSNVGGMGQLNPPDFAREYGYESAAFLSNAGALVVSFAANLCFVPLFLALSKCKSRKIAVYFRVALQGYRWRNLVLHLIAGYLDLCIAAFLQLKAVIAI